MTRTAMLGQRVMCKQNTFAHLKGKGKENTPAQAIKIENSDKPEFKNFECSHGDGPSKTAKFCWVR